jgi:SAM-dependent methyltransferase
VKYPPKFRRINDSVAIDADHTSAKRFNRIEDGMVFHCAADRNAFGRTKTENREIVRFSAATRENNVAWFGPNECGEFLSGVIDCASGISSKPVGTRWISESLGKERQHRLNRFRAHRPCRSVIEIRRHGSRVPVGWHRHHGQTSRVTTNHPSDPSTYGRSFADVYDDWYANSFETDAAVLALAHLASAGAILELGVGTGRLAIPLAQSGLRVVGLDASQEMLDRLQLADPTQMVLPVLGDMADIEGSLRNANHDEYFTLIFCAFNTLLNLDSFDALDRCFRGSRQVLAPRGHVVVEAFVPVDESTIPSQSLSPARVTTDAAVFIETTYDREQSRLHGRHIEVQPGVVTVRPWSVLICGPEQLDHAAQTAGLVLVERRSDWNGTSFTGESATHVSIYAPTA